MTSNADGRQASQHNPDFLNIYYGGELELLLLLLLLVHHHCKSLKNQGCATTPPINTHSSNLLNRPCFPVRGGCF